MNESLVIGSMALAYIATGFGLLSYSLGVLESKKKLAFVKARSQRPKR
jgi:hypothetical protein